MLGDRRRGTDVKFFHLPLQIGIGPRDSPVLAQMFGPGFDHEPFHQAFRIGRILAHAPGIGAIAPPFLGKPAEGLEEGEPLLPGDPIFDQHQHGPAIVGHRFGGQRFGPMARRHQKSAPMTKR